MIDQVIFEHLQQKIDEEAAIRDVGSPPGWSRFTSRPYNIKLINELQELHQIVQSLARKGRAHLFLEMVFWPD